MSWEKNSNVNQFILFKSRNFFIKKVQVSYNYKVTLIMSESFLVSDNRFILDINISFK